MRKVSTAHKASSTRKVSAAKRQAISLQQVQIDNDTLPFPPPPASEDLMLRIIKDCCDELSPRNFAEAGCAVCGQLKRLKSLSPLKSIKRLLHVLEAPGITRLERKTSKDLVSEYKGPVLDYDATIGNEKKLMVCSDC